MKKISLNIFISSVFILLAGLMPDSAFAANYTPSCGNSCVGTFTATPVCGETWTMTVNNVTIGKTEPACTCGAYSGTDSLTGTCVYNLNAPVTPSGGSYTTNSVASPAGYTGSRTWNCSNGSWSPGAFTCTPPPPPTVQINFSLLDKVKSLIADFFSIEVFAVK